MQEFQRFDPTDCNFPRPHVPLLPRLHWAGVSFDKNDNTVRDALVGPGVRHFSRGRYAMHAAYQMAGIGPGGTLLAPAYHCRTMIDPALALSGTCQLYRLNADLTPQLSSIKKLVTTSRPKIKALVLTHYFGFAQPQALVREIAEYCRQIDITLVEDCSHSWQIAVNQVAALQATHRHLLIASPYKFFACEDGGTLWGNSAELTLAQPNQPGWMAEVKALRYLIGRARAARLPSHLTPSKIKLPNGFEPGHDLKEMSSCPSGLYDSRLNNISSLRLSRWVMRHSKPSAIVQQRRNNHLQWSQMAAGLCNARALFPDLSPDVAPYMFALYIDAPAKQFYELKHLGVPIWRWDEMAVSDCPVSADYRLHLLHLPCHQGLSQAEMQWMMNLVASVVG